MDVLDGETDDSSSHLHGHGVVGLQSELILKEDDGSELGGVILDVETILLAFDDRVASAHTNIVDSHLGLMTTPKFELSLLRSHRQQVDIPRGILVQWHRLKKNVVSGGLCGNLISLINNLVNCWSDLKGVRVHLLADLALESLPVERPHILVLGTWWFLLLLSENPRLQALEVDQTDGTSALASDNQGIGLVVFVTPADTALDLVLRSVVNILGSFDLHGFTKLLLVKLFFRHMNVVAPEVLNSESNTTKLDGVEFFDFVVILAIFVLQRSGN